MKDVCEKLIYLKYKFKISNSDSLGVKNRQFLDIPAEFRPEATTTPQMTTTTAPTTPAPTTTSEAEPGKMQMNFSFVTISTNNF